MNSRAISEILSAMMQEVLAGTAFMFVEDEAAPLPSQAEGVEVQMTFSGARRGTFCLAMSVEDSNRLASGMLGRQIDDAAGGNEAAPAEFLNILANWALDAWWGSDVHYRLGTPLVQRKQLQQSVAWSLPADQRAIMRTDANCTLLCGVALDFNSDEEKS
jgi:hypothetical protein